MKTAIQQLLDFIEKENPEYLRAWKEVHEKATELLETEKQQMIAFTKFCLKTSADSDDEYFDNYFESKTHNP